MKSPSVEKIRVLIADDSLFMRTYFRGLLSAEPDILVVGVASTGDEVVRLASELKPHVITMDYHMPGKNGIEATAAIMRGGQPLPSVIMLSAFSGRNGGVAKRQLESSGAHIIMKPSGEVSLDIEKIAEEIIKKIKEIGTLEIALRKSNTQSASVFSRKKISLPGTVHRPTGLVVIGASTGGPPLVEHLIASIDPKKLSVVIVQHMSGYFTQLFAERLDRVSQFHVREAGNRDAIERGCALVVPGGYMIVPRMGVSPLPLFGIEELPDARSEVMIDRTMEAIAAHYDGPLVGVLLSGMGHDGAVGLRAIRERGGLTIVQDPSTALVGAMPAHALSSGAAKDVLPFSDIPERIQGFFDNIHAE